MKNKKITKAKPHNHRPQIGVPAVIAISLALSAAMFLVSILILVAADRWYDVGERVLDWLTGGHYFSGSDWFGGLVSIVGSVLGAVSGIILGIIALVQTERLHELEDRYHRPILVLRKAALTADVLEEFSCRDDSMEQYAAKQEMKAQGYVFALTTAISFEIGNGIPVKNVELESITFTFTTDPEQRFEVVLDKKSPDFTPQILERKYEPNGVIYSMSCLLFPFKEVEGDFFIWLERFVYYRSIRHPDVETIEVSIKLRLTYEFGRDASIPVWLRIVWVTEEEKNPEAGRFVWESSNGYFSYEGRM